MMGIDRLPRYWRDSNLPRPRKRKLPKEIETDVFGELERIIGQVRGDPEQLATALAAWCRLGYPPGNWDLAVEYGGMGWEPGTNVLTREQAHELASKALRGRHRKTLTARADGLILGLIHTATAARAHRLHEVQVDSAAIECRVLTREQRATKLRMKEEERDAAILFMSSQGMTKEEIAKHFKVETYHISNALHREQQRMSDAS